MRYQVKVERTTRETTVVFVNAASQDAAEEQAKKDIETTPEGVDWDLQDQELDIEECFEDEEDVEEEDEEEDLEEENEDNAA